MQKSKTSHCVINIVPPRSTWSQMQSYRNNYTKDARCGPHFSFVDPFVTVDNYPEAAKLLTEKLCDFPPFQVRLSNFGSFHFPKSSALYLEPEFDPPNALHELLKKIAEVFPQCNDQVLKSKSGVYVPHMTIGSFKSKGELERVLAGIKAEWVPITFTVQEIYLLNRVGTDPFEATSIVPLQGSFVPHFGPGCLDELQDFKANRTIVVMGIPTTFTGKTLESEFEKQGFNVVGAEMILNPDGSVRPIGVVEFPTRAEAQKAIQIVQDITLRTSDGASSSSLPNTAYAKPLTHMVFPDVVNGSCSKK